MIENSSLEQKHLRELQVGVIVAGWFFMNGLIRVGRTIVRFSNAQRMIRPLF